MGAPWDCGCDTGCDLEFVAIMALLVIRILNREIYRPLEAVKNPLTCTKAGDPITVLVDGHHPGNEIAASPAYRFVEIVGAREGFFDLFEQKFDGLFIPGEPDPKMLQQRKNTYTGLMAPADMSNDYKNPTIVLKSEFTEKA